MNSFGNTQVEPTNNQVDLKKLQDELSSIQSNLAKHTAGKALLLSTQKTDKEQLFLAVINASEITSSNDELKNKATENLINIMKTLNARIKETDEKLNRNKNEIQELSNKSDQQLLLIEKYNLLQEIINISKSNLESKNKKSPKHGSQQNQIIQVSDTNRIDVLLAAINSSDQEQSRNNTTMNLRQLKEVNTNQDNMVNKIQSEIDLLIKQLKAISNQTTKLAHDVISAQNKYEHAQKELLDHIESVTKINQNLDLLTSLTREELEDIKKNSGILNQSFKDAQIELENKKAELNKQEISKDQLQRRVEENKLALQNQKELTEIIKLSIITLGSINQNEFDNETLNITNQNNIPLIDNSSNNNDSFIVEPVIENNPRMSDSENPVGEQTKNSNKSAEKRKKTEVYNNINTYPQIINKPSSNNNSTSDNDSNKKIKTSQTGIFSNKTNKTIGDNLYDNGLNLLEAVEFKDSNYKDVDRDYRNAFEQLISAAKLYKTAGLEKDFKETHATLLTEYQRYAELISNNADFLMQQTNISEFDKFAASTYYQLAADFYKASISSHAEIQIHASAKLYLLQVESYLKMEECGKVNSCDIYDLIKTCIESLPDACGTNSNVEFTYRKQLQKHLVTALEKLSSFSMSL